MKLLRLLLLPLSLLVAGQATASAAEPISAEAADFFDSRIRPVLIDRCQKCHGPEKQESGLRLDARELLLTSGDRAPAVVSGKPAESPLIAAIRYEGDLHMPPDGQISPAEIEDLTQWVAMGLPWPETVGVAAPLTMDQRLAAAQQHWAFQPIPRPQPPAVRDRAWPHTPVDAFVLAELEARGIAPSPAADRRTLLRRLTFDLTGLPPTLADVQAFERDQSPDAYSRAVERLLASPAYGERWGRHWLDVARYADTKGYVFTQEKRYPYSYTYRDYVVRAFNEDLPYDRFVREQLSADLLDRAGDDRALAALGFLTVGRRFMFNENDIIDDRIDVVGRGLLGLTIGCARCHDHKFDPIPTADYYSLYGVFASCVEPAEGPLLATPAESDEFNAFSQELAKREAEFARYRDEQLSRLQADLRSKAGDYLAELARPAASPTNGAGRRRREGDLRPAIVDRWRDYLRQSAQPGHPVWGVWQSFAALPPEDFSAQAAALIQGWSQNACAAPANRLVREAFTAQPPQALVDVARVYGQLLATVDKQWLGLIAAGSTPQSLPDAAAEELRQALYAADAPPMVPAERAQRLFERDVKDKLTALRRQVDEFQVNSPAAPARAMVLNDAPTPREPHVFMRGNPDRPGPAVPRRFLQVLSSPDRPAFVNGSGRLELAESIASAGNPLTARVLVNRVWLHHFGMGLVRTPSDFGVRSDPPSHPALLDYLAARFMDEGWSIKHLHRLIVHSSTYQQMSVDRADGLAADPENVWLWRMNRRRLEFEALRDAYLAVGGALDQSVGGRPIDLVTRPFSARRTVYGYIDRQDLPGLFRAFDFANPDASNDQRPRTTVPQQALFALNAPFVLEQAERLAARAEVASAADDAERIQALYRLALARDAEPEELELALAYVQQASTGSQPATQITVWQRLAQVLLAGNEFTFID